VTLTTVLNQYNKHLGSKVTRPHISHEYHFQKISTMYFSHKSTSADSPSPAATHDLVRRFIS